MKQEQLEALLSRPLTASEESNLKLYLDIAKSQLDALLCYASDEEDERTFESRQGYRSLFVGPFQEIDTITVDGEATTDYVVKQWDSRNGDWFNVIEFDDPMDCDDDIVVTGDWGFGDCMPNELKMVWAKLFQTVSTPVDGRVKQKSIERGFSVTFNDKTVYSQLLEDYGHIIHKYSLCQVGAIEHGSLRTFY